MRNGKVILLSMVFVLFAGIYAGFGQSFQGMPVLQNMPVTELSHNEIHPAVAYNYIRDEFIVVWQDDRNGVNDIYGRIVKPDGSLVGQEFVVCSGTGQQIYPAVAYNRIRDEYMVVWQNDDMGNNIMGIRLDYMGKKVWSNRSLADTTFIICDQSWCQYHPKIAHNYTDDTFLVVWHDFRNADASGMDIYGQRLDWNADLLTPVEPPAESPATEINFPLSRGISTSYDVYDAYPDVAYHGMEGEGGPINEWLVVWMRSMGELQIWGVRVNGTDGVLLDTWGGHTDLPAIGKANMGGEPPWFPEFAIGYSTGKKQGSPHVAANAKWFPHGSVSKEQGGYEYAIPEFLVAWTDFRFDLPDIYCQRIGYFPDSTAFKMGLKPNREADSLFTAVPLDTSGNAADEIWRWLSWENYPVTTNTGFQSWNDLTYNQNSGEYLVVWDDWREEMYTGIEDPTPPADIYAQRLFLNPGDSALIWLDDGGVTITDRTQNIPIANNRTPDEGNMWYPAPAHGIFENAFLVAYEYEDDIPADGDSIDVYGAFYAGDPVAGFLARVDVLPAEVDMNPGDQQQFEAHGFDGAGSEIYVLPVWAADGGVITEGGLFTAPDVVGDYTITVSVGGSAVTGMATVRVWPTGVEATGRVPETFSLSQNYPNPFNSESTILFNVKTRSRVTLKVFDLQGHEVMALVDDDYAPGSYRVKLNSSDIASGIYLYQITMSGFQMVKKMVVLE